MSSFAYPQLSAVMAPQDMPAPMSVDQAMPPPAIGPDTYLHELGKLLHDSTQARAQAPQQAPQSSNPYSTNNASNPYAIEGGGALDSLASKLQQKKADAPASPQGS